MSRDGLTPAQRRAVEAPGSVAVTAGAGTGKTFMLTERYVHHVTTEGLSPLQIVAATFTDRAASELRSRIRARLRAEGVSADRTAELEAAQIGTLHSLAGRICREHPEAAGVPYEFRLLDGLEQTLWRERYLAEALDALPVATTPGLTFQTLETALRALLDDPYTAEMALAADPDDWPALLEREQANAFRDLSERELWRSGVAMLRAHRGDDGDKMEQQRAAAVAAVAAFEEGRFGADLCRALDTLKANLGSKKTWDASVLQDLRDACSDLREDFRTVKDVLELELGEVDERLAKAQTVFQNAYRFVTARLEEEKQRQRVLDFADLELHALQALQDPEVRAFYAERWSAFLIDEFQDTNPVQAEILDLLTSSATLTIVGDEKQSIYGFRRADVDVFRDVRRQIEAGGGDAVTLGTSFRTHETLVEHTNALSRPALGELHEPLAAYRTEAPGAGPYVSVQVMSFEGRVPVSFRRRAEAYRVGAWIEDELLGAKAEIYDAEAGATRAVRPGDVAILARNWDDLEAFGEELAARGIPTIHAGGGKLFEQREVRDGLALLRFLADPSDDLSLAAVLRSPWFAVSDPELLELAERARASASDSWWSTLEPRAGVHPRAVPVGSADVRAAAGSSERAAVQEPSGSPERAAAVLVELLDLAGVASPPELLAAADARTGFTAVMANLPGGPRRQADWLGFVELVRTLTGEHGGLVAVVRQLDEIDRIEDAKVARPPMEAGDAVALMTIHGAKGLEWPVVILPDLAKRKPSRSMDVGFEPGAGVAVKLWDAAGELVKPALYRLLEAREKAREEAEEMRVLYVALTRARDRLFLTANKESGGKLDRIAAGLEDAGIASEPWAFEPEHAVPRAPRPEGVERLGAVHVQPAGPGLEHLDVTSLSTWRVCPKRFDFAVRQGHPGASMREEVARAWSRDAYRTPRRTAARIGTLTHRALERDVHTVDDLAVHDDRLSNADVERALAYANAFRTDDRFARFWGGAIEDRERYVTLDRDDAVELENVRLHGRVDAVGADFVLDFKTGRSDEEGAYDLQVAAYARALDRPEGHVALLRTNAEGGSDLRSLGPEDLAAGWERAIEAVQGIRAASFGATPGQDRCASCAFERICEASWWRSQPAPPQDS